MLLLVVGSVTGVTTVGEGCGFWVWMATKKKKKQNNSQQQNCILLLMFTFKALCSEWNMLSLTFHISLNLIHILLKNKYIQIKVYLNLLTLSWPAGHMCPTYKESFQVRCDNSIPLFLHAAIYLEESLFCWTSQNAFSRETAMYKWYLHTVSFVHSCFAGKCILTGSTE
jgi:hypothetical protein